MKFLIFLITLLVGIAVGISGTYLAPDLIRPYIPQAIQGTQVTLRGTVVSKETRQSELLLTIDTEQGALLATFRKKVPEIDLLVNAEDTVEIVLRRYEPFVQDPQIRRVIKKAPESRQEWEEETEAPLRLQQENEPPMPSETGPGESGGDF